MSDSKKFKPQNTIWLVISAITLIQSVLALIWLSKNLFIFHNDFYEECYIKAAGTFMVDDNLGILYAIFVRLFGHRYFLYFAQMIAVFFSAYTLTESKLTAIFILTNPLVIESTVMVRPEAFVLSAILLLIWSLGKLYRTGAFRYLFWALGMGISLGFLQPGYAYLTLIALIPIATLFIIRRKSGGILLTLGMCLVFAVTLKVNDMISKPNAYGGVEHTYSLLKMERLMQKDANKLSEWMLEYFGEDFDGAAQEADMIPEMYEYSFASKLEEVAGTENANAFYDYMSEVSLSRGLGFWLKPMIKDFMYYLFTPFSIIYVYVTGQSDTLLFTPLTIFTSEFPKLSYFYFFFGVLALIMITVLGLVRIIKKRTWPVYLYVSGFLALYAMLVCTRGYDFRNTLFIAIAGALASLASFERD